MYDYDVELVSSTGVVTILPGADTEVEVFQLPAVTTLEIEVPGVQGPIGPVGPQGATGAEGDIEIADVQAALEPPVDLTILFENALA